MEPVISLVDGDDDIELEHGILADFVPPHTPAAEAPPPRPQPATPAPEPRAVQPVPAVALRPAQPTPAPGAKAPSAAPPLPAPVQPSPVPGAPKPTEAAAVAAKEPEPLHASAIDQVDRKVVEKAAGLGLSPEQLKAVVALTREVVEQVVWEVVPQLAETMIREEIRRLMAEEKS